MQPVTLEPTTHQDLNQCAEAILRAAPPPLLAKALEDAQVQGLHVWQLLLGHAIKADQRAELHAPMLLPEWTTAMTSPTTSGQKVCPSCRRPFKGHPDRPEARFCCNACGSGTFERSQQHHERCEFFIRGTSVLKLQGPITDLPPGPDASSEERIAYERRMFAKHVEEVRAAEAAPGGLGPIPSPEEGIETLEVWRGGKR